MNDANESMDQLQDPIDLATLNNLADAQGDGEPDLVVELIDLYLKDTPPRVAAMREALANCDDRLMARGAHGLKGSSATLGANQVAESCAELEQLAGGVSFQKVALVLDRLEHELTSLRTTFLIERQKRSRLVKTI